MRKGTISQEWCSTVKGAIKKKMNWWLLEGWKRERSLKSVGTLSMELLKTHGCLRDEKGNGL
ncbi:hypothetical protein GHT06_006828 [Daphnia sinensis]|uniref:Uncharacterized protein n=1 Tax=Daphnia sinensis TaxID=1820382 RepID=A0AAD5KDA7_9CRUS|nr:hypothetical protein GHT06_006828 [Daphnia sinensis]